MKSKIDNFLINLVDMMVHQGLVQLDLYLMNEFFMLMSRSHDRDGMVPLFSLFILHFQSI